MTTMEGATASHPVGGHAIHRYSGVLSGLGKGVTASSIGVLMKACGLRVTSIKIDPYLNSDENMICPSTARSSCSTTAGKSISTLKWRALPRFEPRT